MTEQQLLSLIMYDMEVWETYLPYLAAQVQQEIATGVFMGLSEEQVYANIVSKALTGPQLETLVATAIANYSRSVTYGIMQDNPTETLYAYIGPIDSSTRPECLRMGSSEPLTLSQIESNFGPSVLYEGGGFNCRHKWQSVADIRIAKRMYDPNKAKGLFDGI